MFVLSITSCIYPIDGWDFSRNGARMRTNINDWMFDWLNYKRLPFRHFYSSMFWDFQPSFRYENLPAFLSVDNLVFVIYTGNPAEKLCHIYNWAMFSFLWSPLLFNCCETDIDKKNFEHLATTQALIVSARYLDAPQPTQFNQIRSDVCRYRNIIRKTTILPINIIRFAWTSIVITHSWLNSIWARDCAYKKPLSSANSIQWQLCELTVWNTVYVPVRSLWFIANPHSQAKHTATCCWKYCV